MTAISGLLQLAALVALAYGALGLWLSTLVVVLWGRMTPPEQAEMADITAETCARLLPTSVLSLAVSASLWAVLWWLA